jgi:proline utilization trans-activator
MYVGASARLCNMLQLHQASASLQSSPVEREHRKRVWWSTFCLDRMMSTQLGLLPSLHVDQADLDYPTQAGLSVDDAEEFADPDYLTARVQLTIIQANNSKTVFHVGDDDAHDIETILRPMLRRLGAWKAGLPTHMALEMEDGVAKPTRSLACMRSLANLYLRFNQVNNQFLPKPATLTSLSFLTITYSA